MRARLPLVSVFPAALVVAVGVCLPARAFGQELPVLPQQTAPRADLFAPPPAGQRTVRVHVKSSRAVTLDTLGPEATFWKHLCEAPCDADVPLDGLYRVTAHGIQQSSPVELEAGPGDAVLLDVSIRTNEDRQTGERLIIASYVAAAAGLGLEIGALSINPSSDAQPVLLWSGIGVAAAAIAFTISGYVLQRPTSISQSVAPRGSMAAAWTKLPVWHEPFAVSASSPKLVFPILSTTF